MLLVASSHERETSNRGHEELGKFWPSGKDVELPGNLPSISGYCRCCLLIMDCNFFSTGQQPQGLKSWTITTSARVSSQPLDTCPSRPFAEMLSSVQIKDLVWNLFAVDHLTLSWFDWPLNLTKAFVNFYNLTCEFVCCGLLEHITFWKLNGSTWGVYDGCI